MDGLIEQPKKLRNSRWDDDSPLYRNGKETILTPSLAERAHIFPVLDPRFGRKPWSYQMLPHDYIHALVQDSGTFKNSTYLGDRMANLCHKGMSYYRRPSFQHGNAKGMSRKQIFAIGDTTVTKINSNQPWHDLMANQIAAHIELGARKANIDIANFERIIKSRRFPANGSKSITIQIPRPDIITRYGKTIKAKPHYVTPDRQPFGVGKGTVFNFFKLEADTGTESLDVIREKISRYLEIERLQLDKQAYGIPRMYILFVTGFPERVSSIQKEILFLTKGAGHPRILVKYHPVYNSPMEQPLPDGEWFFIPWQRAAGPRATWSPEFRMQDI